MSHKELPITVVIPVRNEEIALPACLDRLSRFAEVVVIDSGSVDGTVAVAQRYGARILNFEWDGKYPKKRNWFLLNYPPEQPWVLFLDADEIVDEDFCNELLLTLPTTEHNGFWISYANSFRGRPLRHGIQQRKLALFRADRGLYERIDEDSWSSLDMEVHEHPLISGSVGYIRTQIEHRDDRGLEKFLQRHVDYARWEARRFHELQNNFQARTHLTKRQKFKYRNLNQWWYPWVYFFGTYLGKGGILDGAAGFEYAFYKAWYFQTIRLMIADAKTEAV